MESEAREGRTEEVASPLRPEDNLTGIGGKRYRKIVLSMPGTYDMGPRGKGRGGRPTVGRPWTVEEQEEVVKRTHDNKRIGERSGRFGRFRSHRREPDGDHVRGQR